MSDNSTSCKRLSSNQIVYLDVALTPRCQDDNRILLLAIENALEKIEKNANSGAAKYRFSISPIGAALPTRRTPDSLFVSSAYTVCVQKTLPIDQFETMSSPFMSYIKCLFASPAGIHDEVLAIKCLSLFSSDIASKVKSCVTSGMIVQAKTFARTFPVEIINEFPILYIDGKQYCGKWVSDDIYSQVCNAPATSSLVQNGGGGWPVPRVQLDFEQSCANIERYPGDTGPACQIASDKGGALSELVPVIGLLFIVLSALSIACMFVFRRRLHQRARLQRQQRENLDQNERIQDIMQFLALLAAREANPPGSTQNRANIEQSLGLMPVKSTEGTSEPPICTVCLDPVDTYYGIPCNHIFHVACLKSWLEKGKNECPMCRNQVIGLPTPFSSSANVQTSTDHRYEDSVSSPHTTLQLV